MADLYLGFDIGGSRLKSGLVDGSGRILRSSIVETGQRVDRDVIVEQLLGQARALLAAADQSSCRAIGIALPGFVEPEFGARSLPGKLPGLEGFPLCQVVGDELGCPVRCLNDGAAATLGEWRHGAGRGVDDLVVLTLGSGVGSGVVMNGRLLTNRHLGTGGGIGQFTIEVGGRLCLCGNRGCAETRISAEAVVSRLVDHLRRGVASSLSADYARDPGSISARAFAEGLEQGDAVCLEVLDGFISDLGATLVSAIHAYNPSLVVIAGGFMEVGGHFLPAVQAYVDQYAWIYPPDRRVPIREASLGENAGVLGSVVFAQEA